MRSLFCFGAVLLPSGSCLAAPKDADRGQKVVKRILQTSGNYFRAGIVYTNKTTRGVGG